MHTKKITVVIALLSILAFMPAAAEATSVTRTSPTAKGAVPVGVTEIGGLVLDLVGTNDVRVLSQLSASSLFDGFYNNGIPASYQGNPGTIGIQTGFTTAVTNALGGGLKEVAVRMTLYDGDTAPGNFDYPGDNTMLLNSFSMQNVSTVPTQATSSDGLTVYNTYSGFQNNVLCTGWYYSNDTSFLSNLFASLVSTQAAVFEILDVDPYDNYYDFTQGIDGGLIDVGTGPVVTNAIPEPLTMAGLFLGVTGLVGYVRKRRMA